jgi:hypothetical protein
MIETNPGQSITVETTFRDDDQSPFDPDPVTFRWKSPTGEETTWIYDTDAEVVRVSQGKFSASVPTTIQGRYPVQFEGVFGEKQAVRPGIIIARESDFAS